MDTIFALASAPGRAGISVMRLSGPDALRIAAETMSDVPAVRGLRQIFDADGRLLDHALILRFSEGQSFTGDDVVEFQVHGSVAIVAALSARLAELGARMAQPGEFTRRALESGRLDLAQVEGLADLIDAETEAQRRQALRVFEGALGELAAFWRANLVRAAALIEATIDFVDEDVPVDVGPEVLDLLDVTVTSMRQELAGGKAAERIRQGFEVAIVGRPNVGKSTLLNRLAGRDAAITSDIAGTTRDVIEVRMDLGGLPVTVLDTAGLRESDDVVEGLGIALARRRADAADIRIFLVEVGDEPPFEPLGDDFVVLAKDDEGRDGVSGLTGAGVDRLIDSVTLVLANRAAGAGSVIRDRHRIAIEKAIERASEAASLIQSGGPADLIAEELRVASQAVDMIVGRVDVEDLLDEIFRSFCIGK